MSKDRGSIDEQTIENSLLIHDALKRRDKERELTVMAQDHVTKNVIKIDEAKVTTTAKCVDGRYRSNEAVGEVSRPGGDLGLSMALLALGFEPQQAFEYVLKFRKSRRGEKYGWHSDEHEGQHDTEIGCGHCQKSILHAEQYGYSTPKIRKMLELLRRESARDPASFSYVKLAGKHLELGVLAIDDPSISVKPFDETAGSQYFVYDRVRDEKLLHALWKFMVGKLGNKTTQSITVSGQTHKFDEFRELLINKVGEHTATTLSLLDSSRGKPIYAVSKNKYTEKAEVTLEGYVETDDED